MRIVKLDSSLIDYEVFLYTDSIFRQRSKIYKSDVNIGI